MIALSVALLIVLWILLAGPERRWFGGGPLFWIGQREYGRAAQIQNWLRGLMGQPKQFDQYGRDQGGRAITFVGTWLFFVPIAYLLIPKVSGPLNELASWWAGFLYAAGYVYTGHGCYLDPGSRKEPDNERLSWLVRLIARIFNIDEFRTVELGGKSGLRDTFAYDALGMAVVYGGATTIAAMGLAVFNILAGIKVFEWYLILPTGFFWGPVALYCSMRLRSVELRPWLDWRWANPWFELVLGFGLAYSWVLCLFFASVLFLLD